LLFSSKPRSKEGKLIRREMSWPQQQRHLWWNFGTPASHSNWKSCLKSPKKKRQVSVV